MLTSAPPRERAVWAEICQQNWRRIHYATSVACCLKPTNVSAAERAQSGVGKHVEMSDGVARKEFLELGRTWIRDIGFQHARMIAPIGAVFEQRNW